MPASHSSRSATLVKGGVVAGVIGGIVISLFMPIMAVLKGQDVWIGMKVAAFPFLGDRTLVPGFDAVAVVLGAICHFGVSIAWGLVFAAAVYGFSAASTVAIGVPFGLIVWLAMFYAVLPLVGASKIAGSAPPVMAALEHVVFGLAVAAGFLPFQREIPLERPEPERGAAPAAT